MSQIIGIDLGTTFSGAAIYLFNGVKMIPNEKGKSLIPSMVAFNDDQILVGEDVKYQLVTNAENSIYHIKRIIGRSFDDRIVEQDRKIWPFQVISNNHKQCQIKVRFKRKDECFSPEEISAQILKKLKQTSEKYLKQFVHDAVISVPAYFNNNQKAATKTAGLIAGLNVKQIINEPTAAALAYGFGRDENDIDPKNILVYDLGGGTFDISILRIRGREFKVLAINGDSHLGGEDFTNRIVNDLIQDFESSQSLPIEMTHQMRHRLREACEKAKRRLSEEESVEIELDNFLSRRDSEDIDFYTTVTRQKFESINIDLFNMTMDLIDDCLKEAELNADDIKKVILVGGSTRILKIRQMLASKFSKDTIDETVNPDEAVALGAAIEAAILSGESNDLLKNTKLLNVTPLSFGVGNYPDDTVTKFITRNSPIPTSVTKARVTAFDNQAYISFKIYEGESLYARHNICLGEFTINNIPMGPAKSILFDVTFEIDENGILNVTAVERSTKKLGSIIIKHEFGRLTDKEIENLIKHSIKLGDENETALEKADKKRFLERYTYDIYHYLQRESVQNVITSRVEKLCRSKNEAARNFLSNSENATEEEFDNWLRDLKSVCDPHLNNQFKKDENRNIGEYE